MMHAVVQVNRQVDVPISQFGLKGEWMYKITSLMAPLTIQQTSDLALQHHQAGRLHEAEKLYRQILAQQPEHFDAMYRLGVIAYQVRRTDVAVDLIRRAIALNPNSAAAHSNLGNALKDKGQLDEAIAAHRQAIVLNPALAEAHYNLGIALIDNGQLDEAMAAYRKAIALKPSYAAAHCNLGNVLRGNGNIEEAITAYRQAKVLDPGNVTIESNFLYTLHLHPAYDGRAIAEEHRRWNRQYAEPLRKFIPSHSNDRSSDRRLRIGYVSPDFRDHVVGRNLLPLFQQRDRRQFEITCYAQVSRPDSVTTQFQQNTDCWRNIVGIPDEQVAEQIRQDQIDLLVDLALHTEGNRLLVFARKPAPVQVTFAGYPGSTGLNTIDYRLSDPYLDPPGMDESIYSEQTVRLPHSFWCYDPLDCRDIPVNSLPALESGIVTLGCLNNFCKVNDGVLTLWAQVLRQVQGSRLLLLAKPGRHRQRTVDRLSREGIDPGMIEFVSPQARRPYLELYHRVDLGLDSFPYNGHTTSLDSFWMGVPVVTLVGQTAVSRAGWCQLSNLGLTELAGYTPEQFVRIAVELATDLPRLQGLRSTLRQRMEQSPLMDGSLFARNIEAAYRQMWHTWCQTVSASS